MESRTLLIPSSYPIGAVFGSKAANLRHIQRETGARLFVDDQSRSVRITGSAAAVAAAEALLQAQFASADVVGYPHPQQAHLLVDEATSLGSRFEPAHNLDPRWMACRARQSGQQPFMLLGLESGFADEELAAAERPAAGDSKAVFHRTEAQPRLCPALLDAAEQAAAVEPPFHTVKISFAFGKQFFYATRGGRAPGDMGRQSFEGLQALRVGRDIKCAFSNFCSAAGAAAVRQCLLEELGFCRRAPKRGLSLHLIRLKGYTSVKACYRRVEGGELELKKIKSGQAKPFFLTLLNGRRGGGADVRLRVAAQRRLLLEDGSLVHAGHAATLELARACRQEGGRLALPERFRAEFQDDGQREKESEILEGWVQLGQDGGVVAAAADSEASGGVPVRLCVARVTDHSTNSSHLEVSGSCRELAIKRGGGKGGEDERRPSGGEAEAEAQGPGKRKREAEEEVADEMLGGDQGAQAAAGRGSQPGAERARHEECLRALLALSRRLRLLL